MAQGTLTVFDEGALALQNGEINWNTDAFKLAFISNAVVPTASTAAPTLATFTEVSGGNFPAGGTAVVVATPTEVGGVVTFDLTTNLSLAKNASNPANVYYAILYSDTSITPDNQALAFIEIAVAGFDATGGALTFDWAAAGGFTIG